jgi:aminomethyltransferase
MTESGLRHSPLEQVHRDLGAKLGPFGGWLMPIEYEGTLSEHRAVRGGVGLFDLSHLGKVDVVGPTAFAALQGLLTNDLRSVDVGRAQYHHLLNEDGGVEEDLFVYRVDGERWFVVPNASNTALVVEAFREAAGDRSVVDHADWCFLGVQGPASLDVVGALWPEARELVFRGCALVERGAREAVLARTGYTGERGYEIFAEGSLAAELWAALTEAGATAGIRPCGLGARDVLRLEMGYPLYGQDLGPDRTSVEAGLGWAVAFGKGDFRGREGLLHRESSRPATRLRGLRTADRRRIPRAHQTVSADGEAIGEVTSGTFSPTLGAGIALAYLTPAERFEPGAEVEVDIRGRPAAATVVPTPFVDRSPRSPVRPAR